MALKRSEIAQLGFAAALGAQGVSGGRSRLADTLLRTIPGSIEGFKRDEIKREQEKRKKKAQLGKIKDIIISTAAKATGPFQPIVEPIAQGLTDELLDVGPGFEGRIKQALTPENIALSVLGTSQVSGAIGKQLGKIGGPGKIDPEAFKFFSEGSPGGGFGVPKALTGARKAGKIADSIQTGAQSIQAALTTGAAPDGFVAPDLGSTFGLSSTQIRGITQDTFIQQREAQRRLERTEDIARAGTEVAAERTFRTGEREAGQEFRAEESLATREFTEEQNQLKRDTTIALAGLNDKTALAREQIRFKNNESVTRLNNQLRQESNQANFNRDLPFTLMQTSFANTITLPNGGTARPVITYNSETGLSIERYEQVGDTPPTSPADVAKDKSVAALLANINFENREGILAAIQIFNKDGRFNKQLETLTVTSTSEESKSSSTFVDEQGIIRFRDDAVDSSSTSATTTTPRPTMSFKVNIERVQADIDSAHIELEKLANADEDSFDTVADSLVALYKNKRKLQSGKEFSEGLTKKLGTYIKATKNFPLALVKNGIEAILGLDSQ